MEVGREIEDLKMKPTKVWNKFISIMNISFLREGHTWWTPRQSGTRK